MSDVAPAGCWIWWWPPGGRRMMWMVGARITTRLRRKPLWRRAVGLP